MTTAPPSETEAVSLKEEGNAAYKKGDVAGAQALYAAALQACPVDSPQRHLILCNRATALLALGRAGEAVADCDESIRLCPGFVKAYLRKGLALQELGRLLEALEVVKLGIAELSKDETQAGGPELKRLANTLQAAWKAQRQKEAAAAAPPMKAASAPAKGGRTQQQQQKQQQQQQGDDVDPLAAVDQEMLREFQESADQVQELNLELELMSRELRNAEVTRNYVKALAPEDSPDALATFVPVGRMFLRRPCSQVLTELDIAVQRGTTELEAGKQRMKQLEQKVETLKKDVEEALKAAGVGA